MSYLSVNNQKSASMLLNPAMASSLLPLLANYIDTVPKIYRHEFGKLFRKAELWFSRLHNLREIHWTNMCQVHGFTPSHANNFDINMTIYIEAEAESRYVILVMCCQKKQLLKFSCERTLVTDRRS